MADLIERSAIHYTMLYKENWLKGTGEEAQGAWKRDIDAMPAVDAVPVVHGRWTKHKDYPGIAYLCSECNHFTTLPSPYCPDCGAKMDGKDGDANGRS